MRTESQRSWRRFLAMLSPMVYGWSIGCVTPNVIDPPSMQYPPSNPSVSPGSPNQLPPSTVRSSGSHLHHQQHMVDYGPIPRELEMVSLPEYRIEPPDILRIAAIRVIPQVPYRVEPLDVLTVQVANVFDDIPIEGFFAVDPDGTINLGPRYGPPVRVNGLTIPQVKQAIEEHLKRLNFLDSRAQVALAQSKALQQIGGEHLVRPDGTIGLGTYGSIRVVGLTLTQAKQVIEASLSRFLQSPEISIEVAAYNSKVFYVIFDGAGRGQQVIRLPITGRDTVLDAISQVFGLSPVSSKNNIFVARPAPAYSGQEMILPVDWKGISEGAQTATNYQLLPGDRLYVRANKLIAFDNYLGLVLAPFERMFGFTLLGNATIRAVQGTQGGGGGVSP